MEAPQQFFRRQESSGVSCFSESSWERDNEQGKSRAAAGTIDAAARQKTEEELFGTKRHEERAIQWIRSLTFAVLLGSTIALALTTYFRLAHDERADFEKGFQHKASKIISAFQEKADSRVEALAAFADTMVSFAKATNMTWPMVTIPDFERRGRRTLRLASLISILYCPVVEESQRDAWEEHSRANQWWLAESLAEQNYQLDPSWVPPLNWTEETLDRLPRTIVDLDGSYFQGPGPYFPTW